MPKRKTTTRSKPKARTTDDNSLSDEARYRSIVEDQTEFIVRWLPDGTRTFVNESYCRYFGISRDKVIGTSFFPLILPEHQQRLRQKLAALTPQNPVAVDEHQAINAHGEWRWQQWADRAFFNDHGEIIELQSVGRDIHDRKAAEDALIRNEAILARSQALAHIGSWWWDFATDTFTWSDEMHRIHRLPKDEFDGTVECVLEKAVHPDDRDKILDAQHAVLAERRVVPLEYRIVWPDGAIRTVWAEGEFIRNDTGDTVGMFGTVQDVTERKTAGDALRHSEQLLRTALNAAGMGTWEWNIETNGVRWSGGVAAVFGMAPGSFNGTYAAYRALIVPDDLPVLDAALVAALERGEPYGVEHRIHWPDGAVHWLMGKGEVHRNEHGKPVRMVGVVMDITERKIAENALRVSEAKWRSITQSTPDQVMLLDTSGQILFINHAVPDLTVEQVIGTSVYDWVSPEQRPLMQQCYQGVVNTGQPGFFEIDYHGDSGSIRFENHVGPVLRDGKVIALTISSRDITDRKAHVEALEYQATHDSLTNLPNRQLLYTSIDAAIAAAQQAQTRVALFLLDLDRFKEINDTLGHHAGDVLLKQVGPRLNDMLDHWPVQVARLGGDEFAILLTDIHQGTDLYQLADIVAEVVRQPFDLDGFKIETGASIGIAVFPEHGENASSLLRCADVAMYWAKQNVAGCAVYSPDYDPHSPRRLALFTELSNAIRENQLVLHFQPKLDLSLGRVTGFEALVRWQHPVHGLFLPGHFVPLAEMGELIRPLTFWVLDNALAEFNKWCSAGVVVPVAVNLSVRNLIDESCVDEVERLLDKHGVAPEHLELEITESAFISEPIRALEILKRINAMGVRLTIDDFGTGYSSLAYLKQLPIQTIKIDLTFVSGMLESEQDAIIVSSTINLAHNLGLRVVAEGVESRAVLNILRDEGCDEAQGYAISGPLPAEAVDIWVSKHPMRTLDCPPVH